MTTPVPSCIGLAVPLDQLASLLEPRKFLLELYRCRGEGRPATRARASLPALIAQASTSVCRSMVSGDQGAWRLLVEIDGCQYSTIFGEVRSQSVTSGQRPRSTTSDRFTQQRPLSNLSLGENDQICVCIQV